MPPVGLVYAIRSLTSYGGVESACLRVLSRLDRQRYRPHVVTVEGIGFLAGEFEKNGIPAVDIPAHPGKFRCLRALMRYYKENDIKIVHAHLRPATSLARVAGKLAGVPVVMCHEHDNRGNNKTPRSYKIDKWIGRFCEPTISLTEEGADWEAEHTGLDRAKYYRVIANGLPLEDYRGLPPKDEARRELGLPVDVPLACYVGRMHLWKNVEQIVRAFADPRLAGVHLALAGDGEDRERCGEVARELGLADRTHFLGKVPDVRPVYRAGDVFAFASGMEEGQGLVLMEAMAVGTPVIATRVGLMLRPEVHGDEYVPVTEPKPEPIAAALAEALRPERAAALVRNANRLLDSFSMDRQIRETEAYYEEMLARKKVRT